MKKNNFTSQQCEIVKWSKKGIDEDTITKLYHHPLICATAKIRRKLYWIWISTTKKNKYPKNIKIHYYDLMSKEDLNMRVVNLRKKVGLDNSMGVYMSFEDYNKLVSSFLE